MREPTEPMTPEEFLDSLVLVEDPKYPYTKPRDGSPNTAQPATFQNALDLLARMGGTR